MLNSCIQVLIFVLVHKNMHVLSDAIAIKYMLYLFVGNKDVNGLYSNYWAM